MNLNKNRACWGARACREQLRAGLRRKEESFQPVFYGTTSQPSIRGAHLGQNAKVVP